MVVAVTRPRAQGYGVQIGTDYFRVAPDDEHPIRIFTRDSLAQRTDDRGSPEENVLEIGYAFSRSNLTGGEGLDWWPRVTGEQETPIDKIRYWDSENISIQRPDAGSPYTLRLANSFASFWAPTADPVDMGTSRASLYVIEGTNVHRFDDLADTTPDDTDNIAVALVSLAVGSDDSVAVLDVNGDIWFKGSQTDTYLKVYDSTVDGDDAVAIWYVKDRIVAATNDATSAAQGTLVEVAPNIGGTPASPSESGVTATIDTFEGECYSVVDAGHAIIASFSDGSLRSYVPQTDTAGGAPALTIRARTQMPFGEVAYSLGWNLGTLIVFTTDTNLDHARMYRGQVLDERFDYVVGGMQLLRTWKNSTETAPQYTKNVVATRDEMYFWVGETDHAHASAHLWRYDLVTGGVFRHYAFTNTLTPLGMVIFDDRLHFIDDDTIYSESTALASSGYLITPNITFGLNTPINWTAFVLEAINLGSGGAYLEFFYTTNEEAILDPDSTSWIKILTFTDPSQGGNERFEVNVTSNQLALMIKLYPSQNGEVSPHVTRFAARGLPQHRDWLCDVPVNVSDMVEAPHRMPLRVGGLGDRTHSKLVNLQGTSTTLTLFDPPITLQGIVDTIMEPTHYVTSRGSQGRRCVVRFLGNLLGTTVESAAPQGTQGMGIGGMGITTMGIGETV